MNSAAKYVAYNDATEYFTNTNSVLCGALTGCTLHAAGCSGAYVSGKLTITSAGQIEATQNVQAGYTETVCVKCFNTAGDSIQKDNWVFTQTLNCATHAFATATNSFTD